MHRAEIAVNVWDQKLAALMKGLEQDDDSHGWHHLLRVRTVALELAAGLPCDEEILTAAAWLHDLVVLPKNHPDRKISSTLSAERAEKLLHEMGFPQEKIAAVCHAIAAHSFSAGITPETTEAKIVQDADRMEALGALGMLRCFYTSGRLGRHLMHEEDPLAKERALNDVEYALDHFEVKLFKLEERFNTERGRALAHLRTEWLREFRTLLLSGDEGALQVAKSCERAGRESKKLFDGDDPFAKERELQPRVYFLDEFCRWKPKAAGNFIGQLASELP